MKVAYNKERRKYSRVGIESVEKVAEKYDGWVSTSWGNKSFRTMLVLNNSYVV